jgi:hypothetical protein
MKGVIGYRRLTILMQQVELFLVSRSLKGRTRTATFTPPDISSFISD